MILFPPPQYDVPPPMPVIDNIMGWDELQKWCPQVTGRVLIQGQFFYGCAKMIDGKCYLWRVDDKFALQHERAHCAGWPSNHPGGW